MNEIVAVSQPTDYSGLVVAGIIAVVVVLAYLKLKRPEVFAKFGEFGTWLRSFGKGGSPTPSSPVITEVTREMLRLAEGYLKPKPRDVLRETWEGHLAERIPPPAVVADPALRPTPVTDSRFINGHLRG